MQAHESDFEERAAETYRRGMASGLRPDPFLNVSEWADAHRMLSQKSSAEPGRWRTSRTPYLKEIMNCLSPSSPIEEIVLMAAAQVGKTETGNNWVGYIIDRAPAPTLAVQPTVELAKRYSRQRIDAMVDETPRLRERVRPARERDSGNTMLAKEFAGGILIMTGANSAVGLRSVPARNLFMDEIDAYPQDVDGEGDPVSLARARTRTFSRRKILLTSTPTIFGQSRVEAAFLESDQRRFHVPCPHCGEFQTLKWGFLKWDEGNPDSVWLECEFNKCRIDEFSKTEMLAGGRWVSENPEALNPRIAGFHINSLYSPLGWFSWADAVRLWNESSKNPDRLRVFVNTVLGETWKEKGDAPDWRRLYERREPYKIGIVPEGVTYLTAGVDVQKDRLEMQVMGWGDRKESWSVAHWVLPGDTNDTGEGGPWAELGRRIWASLETHSGGEMPIRLTGVDSGFNTQTVYDFVRRFPPNKVLALKGTDHLQQPIGTPTAVDVVANGKRIRRGLKVWPMGSSILKTEIYGHLKMDNPTENELAANGFPPGFIHLPQYDEEYFKQLTAEQIVSRVVKGYRKFEWQKIYERNETLDTLVMARACAAICGLDRQQNIASRPPQQGKPAQGSAEGLPKIKENPAKKNEFQPKTNIIRKRSSFWG